MDLSAFHLLALTAIALMAALLYLVLFEPGLAYAVRGPLPECTSPDSRYVLSALVDAPLLDAAHVDVLTNGGQFYAAELDAIRTAQSNVHLEAYVFHRSPIADRFLRALAERARAGVHVRLVIDAIGSFNTPDRYFASLREAGADVRWYQPLRWYTFKRFNNRTHRELLVIDGVLGFVGGAGVAAWWDNGGGAAPWRDTIVRVQGPLASALQTSFVENWLESTGELLAEPAAFPYRRSAVAAPECELHAYGVVVTSAPSAGKATRARILFQLLIASARHRIAINSPYFLPDRSLLRELCTAARRGVAVDVVVPDKSNNHPIARRASRRRYGALLRAGVRLHEYLPSMMHAKVLVVDHVWSVVGSTNFDNRSFGLNDEVNLAVQDTGLAAELERQFACDLGQCLEVTQAGWNRPLGERALAWIGALLERQQ